MSLKLLISWLFRPVRRVIEETINTLLNSYSGSHNNNNNNNAKAQKLERSERII
jgi:hypothetical protein